jgi:hypothetical protein
MKKLELSLGGHKYSLNDYEHLQNSFKELTKSLIKSINGGTVDEKIILYGCVITNHGSGNYSHTEGAIYYNGIVYLVDALVSPTLFTGVPKWGIITTYGVDNPVQYRDNSVHDVHVDERLKLYNNAASEGLFEITDTSIKKLSDIVKADNKVSVLSDQWHYIGDVGEIPFEFGWSNRFTSSTKVKYIKDVAGNVHVIGVLRAGTNITSNMAFRLPVGYRPTETNYLSRVFMGYADGGSTVVLAYATIDLNGGVYIYRIDGGNVANDTFYLHLNFNIN